MIRDTRSPKATRSSGSFRLKRNVYLKIAVILLVFIGGFFAGFEGLTPDFSNFTEIALPFSEPYFSHSSKIKKKNTVVQKVPNPLPNFQEAKRAAKQIFKDHRKTVYCGCKFDKHNHIDLASCGYVIQKDKRRAERLEWEHIVPISHLARHFECWKGTLCSKNKSYDQPIDATLRRKKAYGGRRCCQQMDPEFSKMEAELHNLIPEIGELNALRSNYRFGMLPQISNGQFGQCEIKIDTESRRVEPDTQARGVIARAYLYMADTYDFHLSDSQRKLFLAWNAEYPPEPWEIEWDNRVFKIQGNHNVYISEYGRVLN